MSDSRGFEPGPAIRASGCAHVGGLFSSTARSNGSTIALVENGTSLTYDELDQRTGRLAGALKGMGLVPGDRIAVLARNCRAYIELELAAAKLGVILAALNWRLSDRELNHCINLVSPRAVIMQPEYRATYDRMETGDAIVIQTGDELERLIQAQKTALVPQDLDGESGLVVLYTSGTTGLPKGALISHRAMIARAAAFVSDLNLPRGANFIAWAPLYHMASNDHALATLMRGGTVFVVDGYRPDILADILAHNTVGWLVLMPGMVGKFAEFCRDKKLKPKGIISCGAMADLVPRGEIAAATQALRTPYVNSFGATETGLPPATAALIDIGVAPEVLPKKQSSFIELRLVDGDDCDVALGEPGEVAVRGPTLFSGYWSAEQTNAHDFRNGWFHMGDVMRRNADGTLDYVDRLKYMIKSGGENIYPAEIEQVLLQDPKIVEAVVVRRRDDKWGEVPVVFIVAKDATLTRQGVLSVCAEQLARYKQPKDVIFIKLAELPRSTTGKVQRHELEKRL
jgi:acyl-CoA synthetase (AMP-forming)/AMP-acid ligase II